MKFLFKTILIAAALAVAAELVATAEPQLRLRLKTHTVGVLTIKLRPSDKVRDLKELVRDKDGIAQSLQLLVSGEQVLLDDDKPLSYYHMEDNDEVVVTLLPSSYRSEPGPIGNYKVKVNYLAEGKKKRVFEFQLTPGDALAAIKHKISSKTNVPFYKQTLMFNGRSLEGRCLGDMPHEYGVVSGSTVDVIVNDQ